MWIGGGHSHFEILAHGRTFDVDAFARTSPLAFAWRFYRRENGPRSTGGGISLGDGWTTPLRAQEAQACRFLEEHGDELRALRDAPGLDVLIVGLHWPIGKDAVGCAVSVPPRLRAAADAVGADVVVYVVCEDARSPA